jgi:hypothetical protein
MEIPSESHPSIAKLSFIVAEYALAQPTFQATVMIIIEVRE